MNVVIQTCELQTACSFCFLYHSDHPSPPKKPTYELWQLENLTSVLRPKRAQRVSKRCRIQEDTELKPKFVIIQFLTAISILKKKGADTLVKPPKSCMKCKLAAAIATA